MFHRPVTHSVPVVLWCRSTPEYRAFTSCSLNFGHDSQLFPWRPSCTELSGNAQDLARLFGNRPAFFESTLSPSSSTIALFRCLALNPSEALSPSQFLCSFIDLLQSSSYNVLFRTHVRVWLNAPLPKMVGDISVIKTKISLIYLFYPSLIFVHFSTSWFCFAFQVSVFHKSARVSKRPYKVCEPSINA